MFKKILHHGFFLGEFLGLIWLFFHHNYTSCSQYSYLVSSSNFFSVFLRVPTTLSLINIIMFIISFYFSTCINLMNHCVLYIILLIHTILTYLLIERTCVHCPLLLSLTGSLHLFVILTCISTTHPTSYTHEHLALLRCATYQQQRMMG